MFFNVFKSRRLTCRKSHCDFWNPVYKQFVLITLFHISLYIFVQKAKISIGFSLSRFVFIFTDGLQSVTTFFTFKKIVNNRWRHWWIYLLFDKFTEQFVKVFSFFSSLKTNLQHSCHLQNTSELNNRLTTFILAIVLANLRLSNK